jgi:hypothetical protein
MPKGRKGGEEETGYRTGVSYRVLGSRRRREEGIFHPSIMERKHAEMKREAVAVPDFAAPAKFRYARLGFVTEFIFVDLAVERGEPDIQEAGGLRLISPGMVQHPLDMQFLDAGEVKGR